MNDGVSETQWISYFGYIPKVPIMAVDRRKIVFNTLRERHFITGII